MSSSVEVTEPLAQHGYNPTAADGERLAPARPGRLTMLMLTMLFALQAPSAEAYARLVANRNALANAVTVEITVFGPVQIEITDTNDGRNLAEQILEGPGRFTINAIPDGSIGHLQLLAVPGRPVTVKPFTYTNPFSDYADWQISQGFNGTISHNTPADTFAVDFALLMGTPVRAARAGIVMEAIDRFPDKGSARISDLDNANRVRILHEDGSMSVYGHLMQDSITVTPGQWVAQGLVIGQSGNSGYSHGPHLHFAVQINTGLQLQSIPFSMRKPDQTVIIPP